MKQAITDQPRLRLVPKRESKATAQPLQEALFRLGPERRLFVMPFTGSADQRFLSTIASTQPAVIVDLRRAARFNAGPLSRRDVLSLFEQNNYVYVDGMAIACASAGDADPDLDAIFDALRVVAPEVMGGLRDPVLFLIAPTQDQEKLVRELADDWSRRTQAEWQLCPLVGEGSV